MDLDFGHGFIPRIGEANYKAVDRCVGPTALFSAALDLLRAIVEPGPDLAAACWTDWPRRSNSSPRDVIPVSLQACFDEARRATGLPQFTLHDLRHEGGTMAAWTGATAKELMARLGHSTHDAALRYQHAAQARDSEIAAKLDVFRPTSQAKPRPSERLATSTAVDPVTDQPTTR